jgi:hypothetical protein
MRCQIPLFTALSLIVTVAGAVTTQIDLTQIPIFNSAKQCVQQCASSYSHQGVLQYNCADAACLCSGKGGPSETIEKWVSSCASSSCGDYLDASTGCDIWITFCYTNAVANAVLATATPPPTLVSTLPSAGDTSELCLNFVCAWAAVSAGRYALCEIILTIA